MATRQFQRPVVILLLTISSNGELVRRQWLHMASPPLSPKSRNATCVTSAKTREIATTWLRKRLRFHGRVVTCFHPPNWHFPLSASQKTFHFSYMKFLCLLKFLFIKVQVSSIFKEKKLRTARIGFALGASALQCITLTPTPPRIC